MHNNTTSGNSYPALTLPPADRLELRELWQILLRRRRLIMLATALALLVGILANAFSTTLYRASSTIRIDREPSKVLGVEVPGAEDMRDNRDFYQTQFELLRSRALASQVVQRLGLDEPQQSALLLGDAVPEDAQTRRQALETALLQHIQVESLRNSRLALVSYLHPDPAYAAKLANAIVEAFRDLSLEQRRRVVEETRLRLQQSLLEWQGKPAAEQAQQHNLLQQLRRELDNLGLAYAALRSHVSVVDPATIPVKAYTPRWGNNLLLATLIGLSFGIAAAFLREFFDNTVRDAAKLQRATGLPVLGTLPESADLRPAGLLGMCQRPNTGALAEAVRTLRVTLQLTTQRTAAQYPLTLVTSAAANEGKTVLACLLACASAQAGQKVLLVDADWRNPSLTRWLGLPDSSGLANYLADGDLQHVAPRTTAVANLFVVPAGSLAGDPASLLASARLPEWLNQLDTAFDQIIIDCAPMLGLADALLLAAMAEQVLVVARAGHTPLPALQQTLQQLQQHQAPVSGLVLNGIEPSKHNYGYGGQPYPPPPPANTQLGKLMAWLKQL